MKMGCGMGGYYEIATTETAGSSAEKVGTRQAIRGFVDNSAARERTYWFSSRFGKRCSNKSSLIKTGK